MPEPSQTLDHVLEPFVARWLATPAVAADEPAESLYVDGYAGAEWAFGAGDPGRTGSRAVAAALAAVGQGARAVLVEEDPALVERLRAELTRLDAPLRPGMEPGPGEVCVVEADFRNVADLLAASAPGTLTRLWLAPATAGRLPWTVLRGWLEDPGVELLLRFPAADFARQGALRGPVADLPPFARRRLEGCSALLGDPRHEWLAAWRAAGGEGQAMRTLLDGFGARLAHSAAGRWVKQACLRGPASPLFLVTGDDEVALELNALTGGLVVESPSAAPGPPGDLFGALDEPPPPDPVPILAERLATGYGGRVVPLVDLRADLARTPATAEQLRAALALLRRRGRAVYRSLRGADAVVSFPRSPAPREARRKPAATHSLDLFGG